MVKMLNNEDYYCFWTFQQAPPGLPLRDQSQARPENGPCWKRISRKTW